jgi:hypothetical protein
MVTTDVDIAKWQDFDLALMAPSTSKEKPENDGWVTVDNRRIINGSLT